MKAVVLEIKNGYAAALREDGVVVKTKRTCQVGDTIELAAEVVPFPVRRNRILRAAAAAVLALAVTGGTFTYTTAMAASYVSLDVDDTSLEFAINRIGRVIGLEALSEESEELVDALSEDVRFRTVDDALDTTLKRMRDAGYLVDNGVVIAGVTADNENRGEQLSGSVERTVAQSGKDDVKLYMVEANRKERGEARSRSKSTGRYYYEQRGLGREDEDDRAPSWGSGTTGFAIAAAEEEERLKAEEEARAKEEAEAAVRARLEAAERVRAEAAAKARAEAEAKARAEANERARAAAASASRSENSGSTDSSSDSENSGRSGDTGSQSGTTGSTSGSTERPSVSTGGSRTQPSTRQETGGQEPETPARTPAEPEETPAPPVPTEPENPEPSEPTTPAAPSVPSQPSEPEPVNPQPPQPSESSPWDPPSVTPQQPAQQEPSTPYTSAPSAPPVLEPGSAVSPNQSERPVAYDPEDEAAEIAARNSQNSPSTGGTTSAPEPSPAPVQETRSEPAPAPVQETRSEPTPAPVQETRSEPTPAPVQETRSEPSPAPSPEPAPQTGGGGGEESGGPGGGPEM